MDEYILSLDQGTTSSRAILFDREGHAAALALEEFTQIYPQPGWVEHDPMEILNSQYRSAKVVLANLKIKPGQIRAVGITNQRETAVVWDKPTGKPVYNAIVWQCRRTAGICDALKAEGLAPYIADKTGLVIDAYFSGTKIKWILDNVPGARERAERGDLLFGTMDTWLIWNLTGGRVHVTDFTNAARTMLFDIDRLCWDETLLSALSIPRSMLPTPLPSSYVYAEVGNIEGLEALAGVPIAGAAGDQHAALFGQLCFEPGQAKNTYGTGCFLLMNTGKTRIKTQNGLLSTIAWGIDGGVEYALEGSVFNAGSVIKWLRDELKLISSAPEIDTLAASVQDTMGVFFVPAFTGLGAPYWDMYARGTIVGLTRGAGRAQIARAVLESIAFQVTDLVNAMRAEAGIEMGLLRVDGGASVSDPLMQFQADMLNASVDRPRNTETTALGAAFLAGLAVGFWKNRESLSVCRESARVYTPNMDISRRTELYSEWKRAVDRARNWAV